MPPAVEDTEQAIAARRRWVEHQAHEPPRRRWRKGLVRGRRTAGPIRAASPGTGRWSSTALHRLGDLSAHAGLGLVAGLFAVVWLVIGLAVGFPPWWETVLYSISSALTLVMVFAIQHTQTRQQSAIQRKLDELLRSQPRANDQLIAAEDAPDEELQALADLNLSDREQALRRS